MSDVGSHVNSFTALPIHLPLISGRVGRPSAEWSKTCPLRIAILEDPDFDCLAANTTAGLLICSDPAPKWRRQPI